MQRGQCFEGFYVRFYLRLETSGVQIFASAVDDTYADEIELLDRLRIVMAEQVEGAGRCGAHVMSWAGMSFGDFSMLKDEQVGLFPDAFDGCVEQFTALRCHGLRGLNLDEFEFERSAAGVEGENQRHGRCDAGEKKAESRRKAKAA